MASGEQRAGEPPGTTDTPRRLNLGCGYALKPESEGWVNADAFSEAPGVVRMDMTRVPWPFPDESFDEIYARHVLEHVPPLFEPNEHGTPVDIFIRIMEEAWRVLKPNGVFRILTPDGESVLAITHWQHYRSITPEWWHLFSQDHAEAKPYKVNFTVDASTRHVWDVWSGNRFKIRGVGLAVHLAQKIPFLRRPLRAHVELRTDLRKRPMPGSLMGAGDNATAPTLPTVLPEAAEDRSATWVALAPSDSGEFSGEKGRR